MVKEQPVRLIRNDAFCWELDRHKAWFVVAALTYVVDGRTLPRGMINLFELLRSEVVEYLEVNPDGPSPLTYDPDPSQEEGVG